MESVANVRDLPPMRNRTRVFADRGDAGEVLAGMLREFADSQAMVLAVPAGGAPVAAVIANKLHLPLDVAVASKITPPHNSEVGYGAVAFDGTVRLNEWLLPAFGLREPQVQRDIERTQQTVQRRVERFRRGHPAPDVRGREVLLVDDGLASGFTMRLAVEAVRKDEPARIIVAVPTAHRQTVRRLTRQADAIVCPNIRSELHFAVADAYRNWQDVSEDEVARILQAAARHGRRAG